MKNQQTTAYITVLLSVLRSLSHLSNSTEHLLLMRVHLGERPDLCQIDVLSVTEGNNLVKGKDEVEAVLRDLAFLQHAAVLRNLHSRDTWFQ